ncbi:MAG: hypothetical protein ACOZF0_20335 [Thermodesulfobacteriota bacterium]
MKNRNKWTGSMAVAFSVALLTLVVAPPARAALIYETTDYITGMEGINLHFVAEGNHSIYTATLSDLSFAPLAFDFLGLSISTAIQPIGTIEGTGSFSFSIDPGTTYFCNIFGVGGGIYDTGLYGLQITAAPVPAALLLFASGLIALVGMKRRPT